jgi:predicted unusual protein kinase regulating ubiquinone biosynthesis (AarF/ABC1/UbiB family)
VPTKMQVALLATATLGGMATAGRMLQDRWDRWQLAQPLERRWGYEEHKRDCLDTQNKRLEVRARSCRSWQEMLEQERRRLLEDPAAVHAVQPRPSESQ